jgi:hypothetical protein
MPIPVFSLKATPAQGRQLEAWVGSPTTPQRVALWRKIVQAIAGVANQVSAAALG